MVVDRYILEEISKPEDMICCPYCGNEEFYVKQKTNDPANYYYRFDIEQDNNGGAII